MKEEMIQKMHTECQDIFAKHEETFKVIQALENTIQKLNKEIKGLNDQVGTTEYIL